MFARLGVSRGVELQGSGLGRRAVSYAWRRGGHGSLSSTRRVCLGKLQTRRIARETERAAIGNQAGRRMKR
jgi:hypothetical protein